MGTDEGKGRAVTVSATVIVAVLLAACDGDGSTEVDEEPAAEAPVEGGGDVADAEEVATEPVDDAEASEANDAGGEDQEGAAGGGHLDLASAQAELDPWEVFDTPPLDVEVPGAPGEAILQLGDQRIEMATGQCRGGPVYPLGDESVEEARTRQGVFRFEAGASEPDGDLAMHILLTEGVTAEGIEGEVMIRRAYRLNVVVPDVLQASSVYQEFPDGRVLDGLEAANTTYADLPNLAVTRDGLITGQGMLERSTSEFIDAPVEVAFSARCSEEWVAAVDELEAEHR